MTLQIKPITLRRACEFILQHHRHNQPPRGHKFSIGLERGAELVGVATAGRPVARHFDDGLTLEVNRTCTDGTRNANSMLYGAIWRCARAMGYQRAITYTQADETGASLRAAGWVKVKELEARKAGQSPAFNSKASATASATAVWRVCCGRSAAARSVLRRSGAGRRLLRQPAPHQDQPHGHGADHFSSCWARTQS